MDKETLEKASELKEELDNLLSVEADLTHNHSCWWMLKYPENNYSDIISDTLRGNIRQAVKTSIEQVEDKIRRL